MGLSVWQILLVVLLLVLLFGRGKISELMGDMARGIKSFKKGMEDDVEDEGEAKVLEHQQSQTVSHDEAQEKRAEHETAKRS